MTTKFSKLSYLSKPCITPYIYETVPQRLYTLSVHQPNREAFIFYDRNKSRRSLTRKQLWDQSLNVANHLVTLGVRKGSPVAFCMSNSLEMLVLMMGVTMAGGITFFFHSGLKDGSDMIETLNFLQCEMLIMDADYGDENWNILQNVWSSDDSTCTAVPTLTKIMFNGKGNENNYSHRINTQHLFEEQAETTKGFPTLLPEDPLVYFCTSGSTGKPKIVTYTHFCVLNWTKESNRVFGITSDDIFFCDRTFSWVVGYPRTYLADGTTRLFVDTKMTVSGKHVSDICHIIDKESCTVLYLPGYLAVDLTKNTNLSNHFSGVATIFTAGERVSQTIVASLMSYFCRRVFSFYGTTEVGAVAYFINKQAQEYEDGIIGVPFNGVEVKIVDENGNVVPYGEKGELVVRCSWRCAGYKNMPETFHKSLDDSGWFHTGDIAHFRSDNNLVVDGRYKEIISTGTLKVFPWSIENTVRRCSGVSNAFAVGVPDTRLGNAICVCAQPYSSGTLTGEDLKRYCDNTFLEESTAMAVTMKPKYYLILHVIPLTASGKIDRRKLAFIAKQRLGL